MKLKDLKISSSTLIFLLIIGIILFNFSNGRWSVSFAAWLAPVFLLRFIRSMKTVPGLIILFLLMVLSSRIMLYGIIPSLLGVLGYILTIYYAILWFFPYLADKLIASKLKGFRSTLIFPISVVVAEYINNIFFGSWASTAYTQFDNLALIQAASLAGIWGISFIVMWFAPVINWIMDHNFEWSKIKSGFLTFSLTICFILLFGGLRLELRAPASKTISIASFTPTQEMQDYYFEMESKGYSSSIEMATKDREAQSILLQTVYDEVFEFSKKLIDPEVKITLWPEGLIKVLEEDEKKFIKQGSNWAREQNVYLLMAYFVIPNDNPTISGENKAIFINPKGELEWEYLKTYPVPGSTDKPGDGIIPISHTPFGKLSSTICYDMDFTGLLYQAGRADVDFVLVPAWDWKAIDPLHSRMAVFRAIENGFSMVRQTGDGLSIAVDYQGRTLASMDHFTSDDHTMLSKIPSKGVKTLYSIIGDTFAWLCILGFVIIVGRVFFTKYTTSDKVNYQ